MQDQTNNCEFLHYTTYSPSLIAACCWKVIAISPYAVWKDGCGSRGNSLSSLAKVRRQVPGKLGSSTKIAKIPGKLRHFDFHRPFSRLPWACPALVCAGQNFPPNFHHCYSFPWSRCYLVTGWSIWKNTSYKCCVFTPFHRETHTVPFLHKRVWALLGERIRIGKVWVLLERLATGSS